MSNSDDEEIPQEIQEAIDAYQKEYAKIKEKVKAHRLKYVGTIYEDSPPLLEEELQFFVRRAESEKERERLEEKYGKCPPQWAIRVIWWKKQKCIKQ